jgi:hypothetical protein
MTTVPRSFLGLSTEYWTMPLFVRHVSLLQRVLSLLRVPGDGPLILRIGGDSADRTFFGIRLKVEVPAIFELTPAWFRRTTRLVRGVGARLILDLNLVTDSPPMAAAWARAAEIGLPPRSVIGFEIGNEPDIYDIWNWRSIFSLVGLDRWFVPTQPTAYVRNFESYAQALAQVAPGVPLVAPAVAYPHTDLDWITSLLAGPHPGLGVVSAHEYPYSACAPSFSPDYPTIARLLSERATAGMAALLTPAIRTAHGAGLPFRLTEVNSVTCGGVAGVSDRFATALWAPDALFELLRAGVDAVNVHVRALAINAAFAPAEHGVIARPLLYGLILFDRTLGPDPQLVDLGLDAPHSAHLKAWAVRVADGVLHVLLINKGSRSVRVDLRLPARGPATVERLLAPSAKAPSGVTLGGLHLGRDAKWHGQAANERITPSLDRYAPTLPPASAALISVHLRAGALASLSLR